MEFVHAYHLVWTTYGTWLPGDARGWTSDKKPGIQPPDPGLERASRERMSESAVILTETQRAIVEATVRRHCEVRKWDLLAVNVRSNHIHLVVSADRPAEIVLDQFKAWCSRKLSEAAGLSAAVADGAGRRRWFTEGGDKIVIDSEKDLVEAIDYVNERQ